MRTSKIYEEYYTEKSQIFSSVNEDDHSAQLKHLPEILPIAKPILDEGSENNNIRSDVILSVPVVILDNSSYSFQVLLKEQQSLFDNQKEFFEQKLADLE